MRFFCFKAALLLPLASLMTAATPMRAADPVTLLRYLVGTWNCSSTIAGKTTSYTAQYAMTMGGQWLRTTNASKGYESEDMMTYVKHHWLVVDIEPFRAVTTYTADDTGLAHIALKPAYPKDEPDVTFDRLTFTKYRLTFDGHMGGKAVHWVDTCTKGG